MKKRMSRLLSALLVLAMVLAMAPAVFAATPGWPDNKGTVEMSKVAGDVIAGTSGDGSQAKPYEIYVGDQVTLKRASWDDSTHTVSALYYENVNTAPGSFLTTETYLRRGNSDYGGTIFTATKNTFSSVTNTKGKVAVFLGCSKNATNSTEKCKDYVGLTYGLKSTDPKTYETGNIKEPIWFTIYEKATGIQGLTNGTKYTLIKGGKIEIKNVSVLPATGYQNLVCENNAGVTGTWAPATKTLTLEATSAASAGVSTMTVTADKGTTHEKSISLQIEVVSGETLTIKKGNAEVAKTGDNPKRGETLMKGFSSFTLTAEAATETGASPRITWTTTDDSVAKISSTDTTGKTVTILPGGSAGEATITASFVGSTGTVSATYFINVVESVTRLEIDGYTVKSNFKQDTKEKSSIDVEYPISCSGTISDTAPLYRILVANTTPDACSTMCTWTLTNTTNKNVLTIAADEKGTFDSASKTVTQASQVFLKARGEGTATLTVTCGSLTKSFRITVQAGKETLTIKSIAPNASYIARKSTSVGTILNQLQSSYPTVTAITKDGTSYQIPVTWVSLANLTDTSATGSFTVGMNDDRYSFDYTTNSVPKTYDVSVTLTDEAIVSKNAITASKTNGLLAGETVGLSCAAESDPAGAALSYQWKKNGSAIAGATSSTYSFRIPASSEDASANYVITCDVTASRNGKVSPVSTSNEVILNVLRDYSISIDGGTSAVLYVGGTVPFTARVLKKDGSAHSGASVTWSLLDTAGNALDSKYATISNGTVTLRGMSNTSSQTIKVRAATSINGDTYSAEKSITYNPAKASSVVVPAGAAGSLGTKNASKIQSAVSSALAHGGTSSSNAIVPDYIIFGSASNVSLAKSSAGAALGDTHCAFSSGTQLLANVYFKPTTTKASVSYVAYDKSGCVLATGEAVFDPTAASGLSITASGATLKASGAVAEICTDSTISYVQFTLPEVKDGKLFYNYKSIISNEAVNANNKYYVNGSSSQYLLDNVYFVPAADCATTVRVQYTAYTSAGARTDGELVFNVTKKSNSSKFSDVTEAKSLKWAADSIDFMADSGLVNGTSANKFSPTNNLIRGDLVVMLYRIAGQPSVAGIKNPFTDVKQTDYYYNAILWAYSKGVVSGTSTTAFSPKKNVTRQDIATILYRYSGKPAATGNLNAFTDRSKVSSYATDAMMWAVGKGYITGTTATTLNPTGNATRAQVAVMLHRFLTK